MTTYTVTATATDATTNRITVSSATNMFSGLPIVFSGTVFGGITAGATYYIGTVVPGSPTSTITVTSLPGGAIVALSTAAGSMTGTFNSGGQQIIDIGAAPDDGTGDPLRTAFNDTNVNFDQVFAAGPVGSNIQIVNNTIKTINTNGNLVLAPNGTGIIQSNVTIVPNTANVRNLGSAAQRWSTIYTQYLDISGTLTTGDLTVDGNLTVQGNIIQVGNIVTETLTIQLANAASTANAANGAGITVGANDNIATLLYNSTGNVWTTNIGLSSVGNITAPYFVGNGSQLTGVTSSYGNANVVTLLAGFGSNTVSTTGNISGGYLFGNGSQLTGLPAGYANANVVAYGESGWAGNIIPSGNAVYSLGNATNQWNDLYVSNATIFMNNVPISLTAGNVLTVDGEAVLSNDSNATITTTGNITAGNVLTGGTVSATGNITANYFVGNGSQLTGIVSSYGNANVANYLPTFSGNISAGNVSASGNVTANYFVGLSGNITNLDSLNFTVENISARVGNNGVNIGAGGFNNLLVLPTEVLIQNVPLTVAGNIVANQANGLYITANAPANGTAQIWNFGTDGRLTFPGTPRIDTDSNNFEVQAAESISLEANAVVNIYTDSSGNAYQWQFGDDGNLTLPGNTIAINYLNGNLAFGTVTFNNEAVIGTGTSNTVSGLYLAPDPVSLANDLYLRVRGNIQDEPTHIHFDTGNNQYYNQFIGDDNKYIQLANTGNIVINTNDNVGNTAQWTFGTDGRLTFPGTPRIDTDSDNFEVQAAESINFEANAVVNIYTDSSGGAYQWQFGDDGGFYLPNNGALIGVTANNNGSINWVGNSSGDGNGYTTMQLVPDGTVETQSLVLDPTSPGHIHLRAPGIGGNIEQPAANIFLGPEDTNFEITAQYANAAEARIHSAGNTWIFANDGNLTLPSEGNIVGMTPNNAGHLQWVGNSSGDGGGYTTLRLIPDDTVAGSDQYLIIDPTGPGHIHIRAGGTQDDSDADLILGGENSHVKLPAGENPNVEIAANTYVWTFGSAGAYGELVLPTGEGVIKVVDDTISLVSLNTTTGNANSVYLGSGGGLGFNDQEIGGNWLEIFRSGTEPEIRVPVGRGNLNIQTAEGANVYNWLFDNTGNLTLPTDGYLVVTTGIIGSGASPAPSLSGFSSIATTGSPGNISASGNLLVSGYANITGNINGSNATFSGNITGNTAGFVIGYRDIPQVSFTGNATIATTDAGKHFYSTQSSNFTLTIANNASQGFQVGAAITVVNQGTGNITVAQGSGVTLYLAGNATSGNRSVATFGMATIMKVATDTWFINGTGVA